MVAWEGLFADWHGAGPAGCRTLPSTGAGPLQWKNGMELLSTGANVKRASKPQTIFRVGHKDRPFSMISNALIRDRRLTHAQRGLLIEILSYPDDWQFTFEWMKDVHGCGRNKAHDAISAFEATGYCRREQTRDGRGRLSSTVYVFTDAPGSPSPQNRDTVNHAHRVPAHGDTVDGEPVPAHIKEKEKKKETENKKTAHFSFSEAEAEAAREPESEAQGSGQGLKVALQEKGSPIPKRLRDRADGLGLDSERLALGCGTGKQAKALFLRRAAAAIHERAPSLPAVVILAALEGNPSALSAVYGGLA